MILSINKYYGSHLALLLIDNHSTVKGLGQNNIRLDCGVKLLLVHTTWVCHSTISMWEAVGYSWVVGQNLVGWVCEATVGGVLKL